MRDFDQVVRNFFKNYQDRGMKKWAGFYLSDHTLKMNQDRAQRAQIYPKKSPMTLEKISLLLMQAFSNHYRVAVQLKILDTNHHYQPDIVGPVNGYQNSQQMIIANKIVNLTAINHVELLK